MFPIGSPAVEWIAVGAFLLTLGSVIKYGGWTFLIAGYDDSSAVPADVAADMVGNTVLRLGVAIAAVGAIGVVSTVPAYAGPLLLVVVVVAVGQLLYKLNTYTPTES